MNSPSPLHTSRSVVLLVLIILLALSSIVRNGVYRSEVTLWQEAVARQPEKLRPHHNLGCALSRVGRYADALREFDTVLKLDDDGTVRFFELFIEKGNAYYHLERFDDAVASWKKGLALSPGNTEIMTNIAVVRQKQGRIEEALGYGRAALAAPDPPAETYEVLGEIALDQKEYDAAASYFLAAIERKEDLGPAYGNAARALAGQGRYELAVRILDQYLSRFPAGPERDEAAALRKEMKEKGISER